MNAHDRSDRDASRTWGLLCAFAALLLLTMTVTGGPSSAQEGPTPQPAVRRLAGPDRAATAAAIARDAWTESEIAVLADGGSATDSLIGAHLAARLDVPLLLGGADVPPDTSAVIADFGVSSIIAIGEVTAPDGIALRRIRAQDPADLAAASVQVEPGADTLPVVLATTAGFADALSAANLAPARLLLTEPDRLSDATADLLDTLGPHRVVVLGGTAAISQQVADDIRGRGIDVERIAGADRVQTALEAADRAGGTVAMASAQGFADAVSLVGWAARTRSAVILNPHDELVPSVHARLRHVSYTDLVLAGGTAALGNFVERQAGAALVAGPEPGFVGTVRPLTEDEQTAMTGVSWREGCPVGLGELRVVEASHWGFDGNVVDSGLLVVHADVAGDIQTVLGQMFDAREPIGRLRPIAEFEGDDDLSMAANNSSGFNCRVVGGTSRWSEHAYGRAVDINPVQNPFIRGTTVDPPAGAAFLDRSDVRPGMLVDGGPTIAAFDAIGWGWGGRWQSSKDYQHVSLTGR